MLKGEKGVHRVVRISPFDPSGSSAKFIVNILLNEKVRAAIDSFIERGGLIIGICNGFQALVKSGLLQSYRMEEDLI